MGMQVSASKAGFLVHRHERIVRERIKDGSLPAVREGNHWVIDTDDLAQVRDWRVDQHRLAELQALDERSIPVMPVMHTTAPMATRASQGHLTPSSALDARSIPAILARLDTLEGIERTQDARLARLEDLISGVLYDAGYRRAAPRYQPHLERQPMWGALDEQGEPARQRIAAASAMLAIAATLPIDKAAKQAMISATSERSSNRVENIVHVVDSTVTPPTLQRLTVARILWVDDRPTNNTYERQVFEALGMRIDLARSTDEALATIQAKIQEHRPYDVIISDMGRPPDQQAGYTLLRALRAQQIQTPFVIYAGSNLPEHKRQAASEGAQGSTNDPVELFAYVIQAIMEA